MTGFSVLLDRLRLRLAGTSGLPILAILGALTGVLVGCLIVAFRLYIEATQAALLPDADPENYEALLPQMRFLFAAAGGLLLGIVFYLFSRASIRVGVIHVLERLNYHEGHLPFRNAVFQFIGGGISIISGHSVGREGPSVHLGAATASLLGRKLRLPNNSVRSLVSCGSAAAIAASFNTPLAGVIFSMEVIMLEYSITGFIPVILAAVSATAITRLAFDAQPVFFVPALEIGSFWELPVIILMGILIGAMAAVFIRLTKYITCYGERLHIILRMFLAGVLVGLLAWLAPEIMGIGYDTVDRAILAEIGITLLLWIALLKLLATAICVGFSLPAGLIGPTLFMGAMLGAAVGQLMELAPIPNSPPGFYAMLGMGAMMGATLQAPLAALIALLELTANQHIIFPGMLAIVSANLAAKELFGQGSIYRSQMREIGLDYHNDPFAQSLRKLGVASVMNTRFVLLTAQVKRERAEMVLTQQPQWLVIRTETDKLLLPAADLARYLEETDALEINLLEIPAQRLELAPILQQATLQQARLQLQESGAEALYVIRPLGASADRIYGIVTQQDIERGYQIRGQEF
ncbi:MAG: chloride channel protein [Thiotrichales bacterium]|nr:chloride channel protein [Thiotrichales bacterium]